MVGKHIPGWPIVGSQGITKDSRKFWSWTSQDIVIHHIPSHGAMAGQRPVAPRTCRLCTAEEDDCQRSSSCPARWSGTSRWCRSSLLGRKTTADGLPALLGARCCWMVLSTGLHRKTTINGRLPDQFGR